LSGVLMTLPSHVRAAQTKAPVGSAPAAAPDAQLRVPVCATYPLSHFRVHVLPAASAVPEVQPGFVSPAITPAPKL
jgi:hypothetical protein